MSDPSQRKPDRPSRLARAAAASGSSAKPCPAERATPLLEAIIEPGHRVVIEERGAAGLNVSVLGSRLNLQASRRRRTQGDGRAHALRGVHRPVALRRLLLRPILAPATR